MRRKTSARTASVEALEGALPFGVGLGHRLRQVREELGKTGDELAYYARLLGLGWDRSTLTRIELGQRQVTAAELLTLPQLYDRSLAELLPTEPAMLTVGASVGAAELHRVLTERPALRHWFLPLLYGAVDEALPRLTENLRRTRERFPGVPVLLVGEAAADLRGDETTDKAARKLGAAAIDVAVAAHQLWGRGLVQERDRRLADSGGDRGTARARQARRGHITRTLLDELRPVVEQIQRARTENGQQAAASQRESDEGNGQT